MKNKSKESRLSGMRILSRSNTRRVEKIDSEVKNKKGSQEEPRLTGRLSLWTPQSQKKEKSLKTQRLGRAEQLKIKVPQEGYTAKLSQPTGLRITKAAKGFKVICQRKFQNRSKKRSFRIACGIFRFRESAFTIVIRGRGGGALNMYVFISNVHIFLTFPFLP